MRRKWVFIAGGVLVVIAGTGVFAWRWMTGPMYTPGMARNLAVNPPAQTSAGAWTVEPGVTLRHFSSGEGRNVLIIHGGPGLPTREAWPGLELLKDRFRFHYYDQRGCGGSTRPFDRFASGGFSNVGALEKTLGLGAQIADIERIRRILGDEKLILIGHSFGGLIAALYAAEFPESVESLVLVAPATLLLMPAPGGDLFETVRSRLPAEARASYDAWRRDYMDFGGVFSKSEKQLAAEQIRFGEFYGLAMGGNLKLALNAEDVGGWMVRAIYFSLGSRHDYRPAMRAVTAPALILHGEKDLQPESATRMYADALPNARFEVMQGCSHFPYVENPETFAASLRRFLKEN